MDSNNNDNGHNDDNPNVHKKNRLGDGNGNDCEQVVAANNANNNTRIVDEERNLVVSMVFVQDEWERQQRALRGTMDGSVDEDDPGDEEKDAFTNNRKATPSDCRSTKKIQRLSIKDQKEEEDLLVKDESSTIHEMDANSSRQSQNNESSVQQGPHWFSTTSNMSKNISTTKPQQQSSKDDEVKNHASWLPSSAATTAATTTTDKNKADDDAHATSTANSLSDSAPTVSSPTPKGEEEEDAPMGADTLPRTRLQRQANTTRHRRRLVSTPGAFSQRGIHADVTAAAAQSPLSQDHHDRGDASVDNHGTPPLLEATLVVEEDIPNDAPQEAHVSTTTTNTPWQGSAAQLSAALELPMAKAEPLDDDDDSKTPSPSRSSSRRWKILSICLCGAIILIGSGVAVGLALADRSNDGSSDGGGHDKARPPTSPGNNVNNNPNNNNNNIEKDLTLRVHYLVQWTVAFVGNVEEGLGSVNPPLIMSCNEGEIILLDANRTHCRQKGDPTRIDCNIHETGSGDGGGSGGGGGGSGGSSGNGGGGGGGKNRRLRMARSLQQVNVSPDTPAVEVGSILVACQGLQSRQDSMLLLRAEATIRKKNFRFGHQWSSQLQLPTTVGDDSSITNTTTITNATRRVYGGGMASSVMGAILCPQPPPDQRPKMMEEPAGAILQSMVCEKGNLVTLEGVSSGSNDVNICTDPSTCHVAFNGCSIEPAQPQQQQQQRDDSCQESFCTIPKANPAIMKQDASSIEGCGVSAQILEDFASLWSVDRLWKRARPLLIGLEQVEAQMNQSMDDSVQDLLST